MIIYLFTIIIFYLTVFFYSWMKQKYYKGCAKKIPPMILLTMHQRFQINLLFCDCRTFILIYICQDLFDNISPALRQLHWLPVRQRVQFKLAVLVFKALHGLAPQCLTDDCQLVAAVGRRQLRSSDAVTFVAPRTRTCLGDRAFGVA